MSSAGIAAVFVIALTGTAIATLFGEAPTFQGSTFNAGDGDLVDDPATPSPTPTPGADPVAAAKDWASASLAKYGGLECRDAGAFERLNCGIDLPTGSSDDSLGQGSKEDTPEPTAVTGSIPNNKSDLTRFYVAKELAGSGDTYLYLAWERVQDPSGTTNMDFEFNQANTGKFAQSGLYPRTPGDLLIKFDLAQGGVNPQLGYHVWLEDDDGQTGTCEASNSRPCWSQASALSGANFEGRVNTTSVSDPIVTDGQTAARTLSVRTFGEAAINMTDSGILRDSCTSFGFAYAKSRSSDSFSAAIKDYIKPIPVNIDNCEPAFIKIRKYAVTGTGGTPSPTTTATSTPLPAPTSSPPGGTFLGAAKFKVYKDVSASSTSTGDGLFTSADTAQTPVLNTAGQQECVTAASDGIGTCIYELDDSVASNGRYWIVETTAPNGYKPAPVHFVDVTIGQASTTYWAEVSNSPAPGDIRVEKVDENGLPVAGAVLRLLNADGTAVSGVSDCTTDALGVCTFRNLPWAVYLVQEVTAPAGYGVAPTATATITTGPSPGVGQTVRLTMVDPRLHRIIVITCHEGATPAPFAGQVVLSSATATAVATVPSPLAAKGVTGKDLCDLGGASFGGLPHGTYAPTAVLPTPTGIAAH